MADIGGIQLLPDTKRKIEYNAPGRNRLLILSFLFAGLLALVYGGLLFYKGYIKDDLDGINDQLVTLERSRDKNYEDRLINLKKNLAVVMPLLKNHIFWSSGLVKIQNLIVPQVQFDSLSVSLEKKEYSFKAFASSYADVAKQIAAFNADSNVTDLTIGRITSNSNGRVDFSIVLKLNTDTLLKNNSSLK